VIRKCKWILDETPIGLRVDEGDAMFLTALLQRRDPNVIADKTGPGISHWEVMYDRQKFRVFKIARIDGTFTDFSFYKCLDTDPVAAYERKVKAGARYEIKPQTREYRDKNFKGVSELSGLPLTLEDCHVDHHGTGFDVLFADFLSAQGLRLADVEAKSVGDFQIGTVFVDRRLAEAWQEWHRMFAKLRVISKAENLRLEKQKGAYE